MRYAKRDTTLEGMPKKTAWESAYGAQRRAIARMAARTITQRTPELPYIAQPSLSLDDSGEPPTS